MMKYSKGIIVSILCLVALAVEGATLWINADTTVHETNRRKLTGCNIALWNQSWELADRDLKRYVSDLAPAYIRIPGGSWANHYYWNGNGVRLGEEEFDLSKLKDGYWEVDYSGFAPGFSVEGEKRLPVSDGFHGTWNVRQLHDFVKDFGSEAIVTVNVGTGTPEMAAEWVRWANRKNNYKVRYWEIGNELEGDWELGHVLPDGTVMNGEKFARRYIEFAKAMKAVDPTIITGGPASSNQRCAFIEELLRDAGDYVDFISFHTYPVENQPQQDQEFYDKIFELEDTIKQLRGWIGKYQPGRRNKIEIAITEWNSKVVEDRMTADLMNGLWHIIWIGEMFRTGVSFANHWDMMTATATGGHGLFYFDQFDYDRKDVSQEELDRQYESFDPPCIPKGQYWAFHLWSRFMGDRMVDSTLVGGRNLYAATTRSDKALQVLLVNTSRDIAESVQLGSSKPLSKQGVAIRLSHREYFWDPYAQKPRWSHEPKPVRIPLPDRTVSLPPFSALVVQVPFEGESGDSVAGPVPADKVDKSIEILLADSTPEDVPVEAWVLMPGCGSYDPGAEPQTATISIKGPGTVDRREVRINEGAGRFFIRPTNKGRIEVTARCGKESAKAVLLARPVERRTEILWRFEGKAGLNGIRSDYDLRLSDTAKPNQQTAAVRVSGTVPEEGGGGLMIIEPLPENLPKKRVAGVVFDIRSSHDLSTKDPNARIEVVLQSEAEYWISIGSIALEGLKEDWKTVEMSVDQVHLDAMKWLRNIRIQLVSGDPVNGEVYFDDVGVILR